MESSKAVRATRDIPLLAHASLSAPFAFDTEGTLSVGNFLADVHALAATLPARRFVLNTCDDRYLFTVALAAALLRDQVTLLPSSLAPATLRTLGAGYDGLYCLGDQQVLPWPGRRVSRLGAAAVNVVEAEESTRTIPAIPAERIALILFTSGSTGQPVPTAKTWGSLAFSARSEALALGLGGTRTLAILGTVPAQHSYGLESTVLLALHNGFAMHCGRPLFPADVCAALASLPRPRLLVTTPVHLRALCAMQDAVPAADLLLSATAALSPELAAQAETAFGAPLMEIYGCSEAGQLAVRTTTASPAWRLMRDVTLRQDARGTWVNGGHVPQETLLADVIEVTGADGFLLHGRTADMINIAGKRTSLGYLNHQLNAIDGVRDGVFFLPDEGASGEVVRLAAFVVAPALTGPAVRAALSERIDAAFLPRPLHRVEALPRNSTGKLTRESLAALLAQLDQRGGT